MTPKIFFLASFHRILCFLGACLAILRACYRARKPPHPENTKKIQNPPPRVDPRKYGKNTEKIEKRPKNCRFPAVFVFFRYFFCIFGGQPGVGDFVFFSYFRALGVFGLCSRHARSQRLPFFLQVMGSARKDPCFWVIFHGIQLFCLQLEASCWQWSFCTCN